MVKLVFIALLLLHADGVAEELGPEQGQASGAKIWVCGPSGGGEKVILWEPEDPEARFPEYEYPNFETAEDVKAYRERFMALPPDERERRRAEIEREGQEILRVMDLRAGKIEISGETHRTSYRVGGNKRYWDWTEWMFRITDGDVGHLFDTKQKANKDGMITAVASYRCRDDFYN